MDAELKPTKAPDHSAQNLASSDGVEPDSSPDARINFVAFLSIATICVFLGLMLARVVQLQVAPGATELVTDTAAKGAIGKFATGSLIKQIAQ